MKKVNSLNFNFKAELQKIEENNDKLKIVFKITADQPLVFRFNDDLIAITENYDIYEIALHMFPVIMLNYRMKHVGTNNNEIPVSENVIDIDTLGFSDYNEFKQFVIKYPTYVRYLEYLYSAFFNVRPWLFLLYTSRISCRHNIKINQNEIEITIGKIRIETIFKKYEINEQITFKLLKNHDSALLLIGNIPIVDFGSAIKYNDFSEILKERPNAILNTLIMLTITLLD